MILKSNSLTIYHATSGNTYLRRNVLRQWVLMNPTPPPPPYQNFVAACLLSSWGSCPGPPGPPDLTSPLAPGNPLTVAPDIL